jgi:hypothetical protein
MPSERFTPLLDQLDTSWEGLREHLQGITEDENLWEPAFGAFTAHHRLDDASSTFGRRHVA